MNLEPDLQQIVGIVYVEIGDGNFEQALHIIDQYKLTNTLTPLGSWIDVAIDFEKDQFVETLIKIGVDLNLKDDKTGNSIYTAVTKENFEMVKFLHLNGAEFDVSTMSTNPLISAIQNQQTNIAIYLLDNGIDYTKQYWCDKKAKYITALDVAHECAAEAIEDYIRKLSQDAGLLP